MTPEERLERRVAWEWAAFAVVGWLRRHTGLLGWWLLLALALAGDIGVVWLAMRSAHVGP